MKWINNNIIPSTFMVSLSLSRKYLKEPLLLQLNSYPQPSTILSPNALPSNKSKKEQMKPPKP